MSDAATLPEDAFTTVAFLSGSPNRIAVLDGLSTVGPATRANLVDEVGISRVTVNRILDDFLARNWIVCEGTTYRLTPVGEVVCELFGSLLQTIESMNRLNTILPLLPADFDVDVRELTSARITVPTWSDSIAPVRRAAKLCRGLTVLRVAASGIAPDVVEAIRDAAVEDEADVEVVATANALGVVCSEPTMRDWFGDIVRTGGRVYEHPEHPYLIATCDKQAVIGMNDDLGAPRGLIESDNRAVFDWVQSAIDRCRLDADVVEYERFDG